MSDKTYAGRAADSAARAKANRIQRDAKPQSELNVCKHLMHDETGQYVGTLQFVPADVAEKMFSVLKNVELLIRINHPMNDGCEMHKDVKAVLELARWK